MVHTLYCMHAYQINQPSSHIWRSELLTCLYKSVCSYIQYTHTCSQTDTTKVLHLSFIHLYFTRHIKYVVMLFVLKIIALFLMSQCGFQSPHFIFFFYFTFKCTIFESRYMYIHFILHYTKAKYIHVKILYDCI